MKHLFLVPVYNCAHVLPYFFKALAALNPKPDYIVFAENNSTDETVQTIRNYRDIPNELIQMHFDRNHGIKHGKFSALAMVCQRLWERARELQPEYVWRVDSDVFIHTSDALDRFASYKQDIVSGTVMGLYDGDLLIHARVVANGEEVMLRAESRVQQIRNSGLTVARSLELYDVNKQWITPTAVSGGLLRFTQKALFDERLKWYPLFRFPVAQYRKQEIGEDTGFCLRAGRAGYTIYLDETVVVDHVIYDARKARKPWSDFKREWKY